MRVYIQKETTNQSFLDMHYYLKRTGRVNNSFMLVLYDAGLAGVNPRDPNLDTFTKQRILREIIVNYWYFIREVARIPESGGDVNGGARFRLDRGSMAMSYLFTFNFNIYVELPRQFGKTTCVMMRLLWEYQYGTSNSRMMLMHKDHGGSKDNLNKLKDYRDAFDKDAFLEKYTSFFDCYDYIVGDIAYSKLRLKGFAVKGNKVFNDENDEDTTINIHDI